MMVPSLSSDVQYGLNASPNPPFGTKGRQVLVLENLALRHQLMVIRRQVNRPIITNADRAVWVLLRRLWPDWDKALVLVKPATVIAWRRTGFRAYWRWKSRPKGGRPLVDAETRELIRRLWRIRRPSSFRLLRRGLFGARFYADLLRNRLRNGGHRRRSCPSSADRRFASRSFSLNYCRYSVFAMDRLNPCASVQ